MSWFRYQWRVGSLAILMFLLIASYYYVIEPLLLTRALDLSHISGTTHASVIEEYGEPTKAVTFLIGDIRTEDRVELLNYYPQNAGNTNVQIYECKWTKRRTRTVVWFHLVNNTWVVLHAKRYSTFYEA